MKLLSSLTAGLAGAVVLTVTYQLLQKFTNDAPRMDLLGEEALEKALDETGLPVPENIYDVTMAADIAGNSIYYALVAAGNNKNAIARGALLGMAAGAGGLLLPEKMGLTAAYSNRTLKTSLLTFGIYTLGGIVSGAVLKLLEKSGSKCGK